MLAAYRPRYAKVAALAGLAGGFGATCEPAVVQRLEGNGMTEYYGVSGRSAEPELEQMSEAACERKIALLQACTTDLIRPGVPLIGSAFGRFGTAP